MIDFSVIIPTYKDWGRLKFCIENLLKQDTEGITAEIIVVDNELYHNPPEYLKKIGNIKILHEPNPGSYAARNRGAAEAIGKYLAFTDADCIPAQQWLTNAYKIFKNIECDLIGGRVELFKPEDGGKWAYIYEKFTAFRQDIHVPEGKSVTANLFVKREAFDSLSGFDSDIKSGGDWEFTERAVSEGFNMVYGDNTIVKHPTRTSIREIMKKQKRFAAWGYVNVIRNHGHSGLRIITSNILNGTPAVFKKIHIPNRLSEKFIVFIIALHLHLYKIILQTFFLMKVMNPEKIRQ